MWRTGLFLLGIPLAQFAYSTERVRVESTVPVRDLTDGSNPDRNPRYSPDGKWVAFSSSRQGKARIYVMSASLSRPESIGVCGSPPPRERRV